MDGKRWKEGIQENNIWKCYILGRKMEERKSIPNMEKKGKVTKRSDMKENKDKKKNYDRIIEIVKDNM